MRSLGSSGIWELFVPGIEEGAAYKFEIRTQDGRLRIKADPVAFAAELPPANASIVHRSKHEWSDAKWLERRAKSDALREPMSIYEVHLGSWRRNPLEGNRSLNYLELADELSAYVSDLGFTARRADADHGASVRRFLGLSGDRVLRADVALRHARRLPYVRRPDACKR